MTKCYMIAFRGIYTDKPIIIYFDIMSDMYDTQIIIGDEKKDAFVVGQKLLFAGRYFSVKIKYYTDEVILYGREYYPLDDEETGNFFVASSLS